MPKRLLDAAEEQTEALVATVRPQSLKRAVSNLVDNAMRHVGRVDVALSPSGTDHFVIAVDDDGPGINAADPAKALMPFRRLEGARSKSGDGAGLGLPATLKSVERAGGSLTLGDSKLGGLRVEIRLPRR